MATERTRTAAQAVVGVAVVVVAVGLGILVLRTAWRSVAGLDPQFAAALAVATATIVTVPLTRWFDGRRLREEPLQGRKVEVYERFIRGFLDNFFDNKRGGIQNEKLADFMFGITPDLTIWASDDVLRRWSLLRRRWAWLRGSLRIPASSMSLRTCSSPFATTLVIGTRVFSPAMCLGSG